MLSLFPVVHRRREGGLDEGSVVGSRTLETVKVG